MPAVRLELFCRRRPAAPERDRRCGAFRGRGVVAGTSKGGEAQLGGGVDESHTAGGNGLSGSARPGPQVRVATPGDPASAVVVTVKRSLPATSVWRYIVGRCATVSRLNQDELWDPAVEPRFLFLLDAVSPSCVAIVAETKHHHSGPEIPEHHEPERVLGNRLERVEMRCRGRDDAEEDAA